MDNKIQGKTTSSNGSIEITTDNNQEIFNKVITGSPYGDKVKQPKIDDESFISQDISLALRKEYGNKIYQKDIMKKAK